MLVPSVASTPLVALPATKATLLLLAKTLPTVSASHRIASAMENVGTSHADVARKVSPRRGVINVLALLARPSAVSRMAEKAMIVLISKTIARAVGVFVVVTHIVILRTCL
jgi:hypothetical protein